MTVVLPPQTLVGPYSYVLTRQWPVKVALYNRGTNDATFTFFGYSSDTQTETIFANSTIVRDFSDIHTISGNAAGTVLTIEVVTGDEDIDPRYIGGTVTSPSQGLSLGQSTTGHTASATKLNLTYGTNLGNAVIVAGITTGAPTHTVTSISDTAGLSWMKFASMAGGSQDTEMWWASSATALSADTVTVSINTADAISVTLVEVDGSTSYTSPWDANTSLPATNSGSSNAPASAAFSTNGSKDFVLALLGNNGAPAVTQPAGYTQIGIDTNPTNALSYDILSSAASSVTLTWALGGSEPWETIVGAIAG